MSGNWKQFRKIYFPRRIIPRIISRKSILQKYSYASWKYFLRNPKVQNYENEHFQKSHFFKGCQLWKNTLFRKLSFSRVRQKIEKVKTTKSKSRKAFPPQNHSKSVFPLMVALFLVFLLFKKVFSGFQFPRIFFILGGKVKMSENLKCSLF